MGRGQPAQGRRLEAPDQRRALVPAQALGRVHRAHGALQIPRGSFPFTIENAFPAALRRQALAEGAYAISDKVQNDLIRNSEVAQKVFAAVRGLAETDDADLYLMAPRPEAKDAFATWITAPARLTPANFAAFEIVLSRLKDLLAQHAFPRQSRAAQQQLREVLTTAYPRVTRGRPKC